MPNLLIRNLPQELHARLKASAESHRRSVTQETIATLERGLSAPNQPGIPTLPAPLVPRRPIAMDETLRFIEEGRKNHSQPGWAKDTLRILQPIEGPAIPDGDWDMLHDDPEPLK
jgi:plasmid stability protein